MAAQGHPLVVKEWRGNPHTTGQAATGLKATSYTGTAKGCAGILQQHERKLKVKTIHTEASNSRLGTSTKKNAVV